LKTKDIIYSLNKKGFVQDEKDHKFFYLFVNNKKTSIFTKISHGESEIDDSLIGLMAGQTRLRKKGFLDLIKCPLSFEKYVKILQENGNIVL